MAPARKQAAAPEGTAERVRMALAWLEEHSTDQDRDNLVRFGINADPAYGTSMKNIQILAKQVGRDHVLAAALWETGWYEARMLCSFVDEPAQVTIAQMDRWCKDFDNWGICDTVCFKLFDQVPQAWSRIEPWSRKKPEFEKRAAFALLASLAGHDKKATNEQFLEGLRLIELAATDERNFVMKGVSWALRRIGGRNAVLYEAAEEVASRLAESPVAAARWIGKDALRDWGKGKKK